MEIKDLKIAIYYDWLNQWGGAEKVLQDIIKIFPSAPIYTLVHDPKKTDWLPSQTQIYPSIINQLPFAKKNNILYTPFYALALEQFDFSQYDIVISTTQVSGHCLLTHPNTLFLCYMHNINRYVYQTPNQFLFLKPFLDKYKKTDFVYGQRPDYLFCNSKTVQKRIQNVYHRTAQVINPGVDTLFFIPKNNQLIDKYFLIVSRLVTHKRIDLAIRACQKLNQKLIIVGEGRDKQKLIQIKNKIPNNKIVFLGKVSPQKLRLLYQNCQALLCPQIEDFGLAPLEAQACGKPVIAFNYGGLTETIINGKTGILYPHQTIKSLIIAINKFNSKNFSETDCVTNAARFSQTNFMLDFRQTVNQLWQQHQTIIL